MSKIIASVFFTASIFASSYASSLTSGQLRNGLSSISFDSTYSAVLSDTSHQDEYWYWLNLARLHQAKGEYDLSILSFEKAYAILDEYENRATISLRNIGSFLGSSFLSKGSETYYGKGYERTLMHTLNALNYVMLGDLQGAAVEMRRMEQRQEFWLVESDEKIKKAAKDQAQARARNTDPNAMPLNYSMASLLQDEDVRTLVNNYQDPFSYALKYIISDMAGLEEVTGYEGLTSLKRAVALNPYVTKSFFRWPNLPLELSNPPKISLTDPSRSPATVDVSVVVLSGEAPSMKIEKVRFPIFHAAEYTSIDLPSYTPPINDIGTITISAGNLRMQPPRLLKSNAMAYRTLKDELPGELAKAAVRATTKAIAAKQATDHFGSLGGLMASVVMDIGSSAADSGFRNWELLPNSGYLMKFEAKKGETVTIHLNGRQESFTLPSDQNRVFVLVSYLTNDNIRIDHVNY